MSFALYLIGFVLIMIGVTWALFTIGVAVFEIAIIGIVILGIALLVGVVKIRRQNPPRGPSA